MTSGHLFATRAESVAFEHAVFTTGNNTRNSRRELRKLECYPCKILHRNNTKCPLNSNHTKLGKQNVNSMKQKATKMSNYISRSSSKIKIPSILMLMLICLLLAITIKTTVATTSRLPPNHLNTNQKDHDIEQQQQAGKSSFPFGFLAQFREFGQDNIEEKTPLFNFSASDSHNNRAE